MKIRKKGRTPEQGVKNDLCRWLHLHMRQMGLAKFWVNKSLGVWDAKRGCYRRDNSPYAINGVPDILGYFQGGRFFGVEVKTDDVKDLAGERVSRKTYASAEQREFIKEASQAGCVVFVARNVDDLREKLLTHKNYDPEELTPDDNEPTD